MAHRQDFLSFAWFSPGLQPLCFHGAVPVSNKAANTHSSLQGALLPVHIVVTAASGVMKLASRPYRHNSVLMCTSVCKNERLVFSNLAYTSMCTYTASWASLSDTELEA